MSFVGDIVSAAVNIVISVVEIVVQIIEVIIELIMSLLGYNETSHTIEYFEVYNHPLFTDVDKGNPLLATVKRSILSDTDIAGDLIYAQTFRSIKGDVQKFLNYIDNGNYFEGFPTIESYITYPDYTELSAALLILEGVPCTPENSYTKALDNITWIKSWLQENKNYSVETNILLDVTPSTSTSPATISSSFIQTAGSPNFVLTITDEIATSDSMDATTVWYLDTTTIVYNSGPDTYSIDVYNEAGDTRTLGYTIPSKPLGLHYVSYYYINSAPSVTYLFVYKVGTGTYPDLDNPQNEININATVLQALPAIPLRVSNVDYTSRPAEEVTQIEELCDLVSLDALEILNTIKNDPDAPTAGDLDHIYVTFGIRMWDTSQTGMAYLFRMCENLFPAQGVTKGIYDDTPSGDTKPANNIIITTGDYKYLFQFSYISYNFTSLTAIDADTGSPENGYYYSDMSRFDSDGILRYEYYISSGKGTYNVGYKADTLAEVQNFLDGIGTVNPGITTGEATNWLQVTKRMVYNNPTPVLLDADNTTSSLTYLTPDLIYENNGSGVLRHVQAASEETTSGQSITYYRAIASGLEAYTMAAPIASLRVVDGATGVFKMVKFNLGNRDDLMVPFIHNFIADLSNKDVTQLFLAGSHASIYVAHYEVIVQRTGGFGGLFMIVLLIIIVIVAWYAMPYIMGTAGALGAAGTPTLASALGAVMVPGTTTIAWGATFMNLIVKFVVNQIVQMAIGAIFGKDSAIGKVVGMIAGAVVASGFSYGYTSAGVLDFDMSFSHLSPSNLLAKTWGPIDLAKLAIGAAYLGGTVLEYKSQDDMNKLLKKESELQADRDARLKDLNNQETVLRELYEALFATQNSSRETVSALYQVNRRVFNQVLLAENIYNYYENATGVLLMDSDYENKFINLVDQPGGFSML